MNIFFDLDGTLLDARQRVYKVFNEITQQNQLSFDNYWELKRNKLNHVYILKELLGYNEEKIATFTTAFLNHIELRENLDIDTAIEGSEQLMQLLVEKKHQLYIVTARQKKESAQYQIEKLQWNKYFEQLLVTEQTITKAELIKPHLQPNQQSIMVGDTGKDIETGKTLNIGTVAVLSGFLNQSSLLPYKPDFIINNITELTKLYNF